MRHLIALLLLACCGHAAAAATLPPCERAVRFQASWFADPEVDASKTAAQVSSIGASASGGGTQLGHVMVQTRLAVQPQASCEGYLVGLEFIKPVLRVASEFPGDSCSYARVMHHEQTHVRIYRDIARQFRQLDYPWSRGATPADLLAYARLELDRLMQAQVQFDSPEEYARNQTVCGGEILRLMKTAAAPQARPAPRKPG